MYSLKFLNFCPFEVKSVFAVPLGPTQIFCNRPAIHLHSIRTECLWKNFFINLMEITHMAFVIYLPEKPLKKVTGLINPNCSKKKKWVMQDDTRLASEPASLFCSHKISSDLKWSSKGKVNKMKIVPFTCVWAFLLTRKNNTLANLHTSMKQYMQQRFYLLLWKTVQDH